MQRSKTGRIRRANRLGIIALMVCCFACACLLGAPTTIPATLPSSAPSQGNSATQPLPRLTDRHAEYVKIAKKGVDVMFVGDSITDNWRQDPQEKPNVGGRKVWDEVFAPLNAANFGISSDQTQHVLWRMQHGELDGPPAKVIVLMIGTNNLRTNTVDEVAQGITAIVDEMKKRSPTSKILLLGIFPRGQTVRDGYRPRAAAVNAIISKLHDGKTVFYMDLADKFIGPDGMISADVMADRVHPTPQGYRIWADAILPKVKELLETKSQ